MFTSCVYGIAIFKSKDYPAYYAGPIYIYYLNPMFKIVVPIKDLLIALSFVYLYYFQGMKRTRGQGANTKIDPLEEPKEDFYSGQIITQEIRESLNTDDGG